MYIYIYIYILYIKALLLWGFIFYSKERYSTELVSNSSYDSSALLRNGLLNHRLLLIQMPCHRSPVPDIQYFLTFTISSIYPRYAQSFIFHRALAMLYLRSPYLPSQYFQAFTCVDKATSLTYIHISKLNLILQTPQPKTGTNIIVSMFLSKQSSIMYNYNFFSVQFCNPHAIILWIRVL